MYGTSKTLTTKLTSYHLIYDIPKADTLERTLPLPMDLTLKVLQLKHTKYMYVFKIKKKVIIQWTYSILALKVLIMSRTRLSWYTVQPPDKRHLATCKFWYKVIATAHKGTHQSEIMFLQTTKHAHREWNVSVQDCTQKDVCVNARIKDGIVCVWNRILVYKLMLCFL